MKNKKGFTLIELLAVIVILAIIALIAVPIVLNMITQARKSAARSAALGYVDAIEYNNGFAESEIAGYTKIIGQKSISEIDVKMKGKKPDSGTVTINENGKVTSATLCINGYTVTYDGDAHVGNKCSGNGGSNVSQPNSFETDSWATIAANTTSNVYNIGDRKAIVMDVNDDGVDETYYVRIANKESCASTVESESACDFVLEFEGMLNVTDESKREMNSTATAVGGWRDTPVRTYLNSTIYNKLPSDLKSLVKSTKVISSSEMTSVEPYETQDYLYLLSVKELGLEETYENGKTLTKTLEYYVGKDNDYRNKKRYGGSTSENWWTRSAYSTSSSTPSSYFWYIYSGGGVSNANASMDYGLSPAFRIGNTQ